MRKTFLSNLKSLGAIALICGLGFPGFAETYGDFEYSIHDGSVTITRYTGNASAVNVPDRINGLPVTSIGYYDEGYYFNDSAFSYCISLISVTIPASVAFIEESAFDRCDNLTGITVDGRNPAYRSYNGVLFDKQMRTLIRYPEGKSESPYTVPGSVTAIGDQAFAGCRRLTSVTISSSVAEIGYGAFAGCTNLTSVTIPASIASIRQDAFIGCNKLETIAADGRNPVYRSYNGVLFDKPMRTLILYPKGKSESSYTVPGSVTAIGAWAFEGCNNLNSVTIPGSVAEIGYGAFARCASLTSVTIPDSDIGIETGAFAQCESLNPAVRADIEKRFGYDVFFIRYRLFF